MKKNVTILGATGAVGREMLKILEERDFPIEKLTLLSSKRSAGKTLSYKGEEITLKEATDEAFEGADIVLGAADNPVAKQFAPAIVKAGAVFVDNSSAFRMNDEVPLVIPEINPEDVKWHKGIISNPNCSTIITLMAASVLNRLSPIETMVASTYQAASGAGAGGPIELAGEIAAYQNGESYEPRVFPYPLAYNVIPAIGSPLENGYTTEEMKMQNEGRKILHLPELLVTCTCVRVPVMRSHSISATVVTKEKITVGEAKEAFRHAEGVLLEDDLAEKKYPMPLLTSGKDITLVGRIREDLTNPRGLSFFVSGDQVRKGAALNTIQIAELLL